MIDIVEERGRIHKPNAEYRSQTLTRYRVSRKRHYKTLIIPISNYIKAKSIDCLCAYLLIAFCKSNYRSEIYR